MGASSFQVVKTARSRVGLLFSIEQYWALAGILPEGGTANYSFQLGQTTSFNWPVLAVAHFAQNFAASDESFSFAQISLNLHCLGGLPVRSGESQKRTKAFLDTYKLMSFDYFIHHCEQKWTVRLPWSIVWLEGISKPGSLIVARLSESCFAMPNDSESRVALVLKCSL